MFRGFFIGLFSLHQRIEAIDLGRQAVKRGVYVSEDDQFYETSSKQATDGDLTGLSKSILSVGPL